MLGKSGRLAARTAGASPSRRGWRSDSGVEAVEFALVLPVLLTLLFGIITMGTVFFHYEMLISATEAGCRYLSSARGATTTPFTNAVSAVDTYATGLYSGCQTSTNTDVSGCLTVVVTIQGTACATDAACLTLLTNGQGDPVVVKTTYPCTIFIMGVNFAPGCTLTQQLTEAVE